MIAYYDTSALVPLLIREPTTDDATLLFESADRVVSARLVYPEARAALAAAHRSDRLTTRQLRAAVRNLDALTGEIDIVELTEALAHRAGELAESHGLRGYDAVHVAAAELVRGTDLVFVTGDRAQARAAASLVAAVAKL